MDGRSDAALEEGWRGERVSPDDERGGFILRRGVAAALQRWWGRQGFDDPVQGMTRAGRLERIFTLLGLREWEMFAAGIS